MKRLMRILAATAVLVTASACGGSSSDGGGGGSGLEASLQGTWVAPCQVFGATASERSTIVFSGLNFTSTFRTYANSTCTGTGTVQETSTGSFVVGSTVTVTLGSTPVTAYQISGTSSDFPGETFYDLAYVDTAATPDRFYMGDTSGVNDGTTAAKRPTALDTSIYLEKV